MSPQTNANWVSIWVGRFDYKGNDAGHKFLASFFYNSCRA